MLVRSFARRASLVPLFILMIVIGAQAQRGGERFSFDDLPVDDARQYYVAIGAGYLGMFTSLKYDELNRKADAVGLAHLDGPLTMHGGGGIISVLFIPHLRIGLFGEAGSKVVDGVSPDSTTRSLRFGTSVTGVQFDYAIRMFKSATFLPGFMAGSENYSVEYSESKNPTYDQFLGTTPGSSSYNHMTNSHVFIYPAANVEYAITQFIMLRAGVGYKMALGADTWTDQAGATITGVPTSINANGLTVQFGVFLGLFQSQ